jgi:hypothetical protein
VIVALYKFNFITKKTRMSDIEIIANRLVTLLKQKKFLEAQEELFAADAVSQEPEKLKERSVSGLDAIMQKEKYFLKNIKEWNRFEITKPIISKNHFSVGMITEVEMITGDQISINEIIVYEVGNGKIIKEQFFFN